MRDEIGLAAHTRGAVGLSTRGRDTGDAQIFINLVDNPRLDFEYTVFGYVNPDDMDTVDGIAEGDAIDTIKFDKTTTEEKAPPRERPGGQGSPDPMTAHRRAFLRLLLAACALPARGFARQDKGVTDSAPRLDPKTASYHVHPNGRIQDALEAAARDPVNKTVYVHAGTYRPPAKGQALIWFNARHDGITLEAVGDVVLTAANPEIADAQAPSSPAIVNHVVYFGDGVSRKTVFRGFKVTGANNFTTGSGQQSPIESDDMRKTPFFYWTAAASRCTRASYPTIEQVEVYGNYTSPCGGGVSVEHLGQPLDSVLFRNCIFRNNRTQIDGIGPRSSARQPGHDRELPLCRERGQPGRGLRRPADRGRISSGAWLRRHDGVRRISGDRQPEHVHRQLERRGRQRNRKHLRRDDLLEEQPRWRHFTGAPV